MKLTNTLSREKEEFKPLKIEKVKVYYCWPTPYNYAHIWNLRAYLFSDMVVRTLRFLGYRIETAMNVTDIDDKTIFESQKQNISLKDFTKWYFDAFLEDIEKIWIKRADFIVSISDIIPEMINIINGLLDKGYAYLADDGSIYYSISKFKEYWRLAHLNMKWMKSSVRINNDEYEKEDVGDFVLWKAYNENKDWPNRWEWTFRLDWKEIILPWRPWWHIECSACNYKVFWDQIDLHMWGVDNIFPHHQNELAQSEAFTWKVFSKYWMHNWHILVDNQKMSKSKNNFYTLRDIEQKLSWEWSLDVIHRWFRFMTYKAKYSDSFNFTFEKLKEAMQNIRSFDEMLKRLKSYKPKTQKTSRKVSDDLQEFIQWYVWYLEDDFNTAEATALVFDFVKYINSWIDSESLSSSEIEAIIWMLKAFNEVLNVFDFTILEDNDDLSAEILSMLEDRNLAKALKDYTRADELRTAIEWLWYKIIDEKGSSRLEKIK